MGLCLPLFSCSTSSAPAGVTHGPAQCGHTCLVMQAPHNVDEFLYHPQEHFWSVPLAPHHARAWQFFSGVAQGSEVLYILVGEPMPNRLLSRFVVGAEAHSVNFMTRLLTRFFYIPMWVFPGDTLFLLAFGACHYYVMSLHAEAPPILDESSNQKLSHLDTPSHMHSIIKRDAMRFILHPTFGGETSFAHHTPSIPDTLCFDLICSR